MQRVNLLDYGRLLAAISVMSFHYFFNGIINGKLTGLPLDGDIVEYVRYGYLGVEFFFIISGYVIACSFLGKTPGAFATSRAVRLLPALWVAMLVTTLVSHMWGTGVMVVGAKRLLTNFTMAPQLFGQAYVDGVYWTLAYEIAFYALIFVLMLVIDTRKIATLLLAWPWALVAARLIGIDFLPFLGSYFCFFAAGAAFAMRSAHPIVRIGSILLSLYLCIAFSIDNAAELGVSRRTVYDPAVIGGIITAMFAFFALLDIAALRAIELPAARLAGGVTYPLYLLHAHIGYMTLSAFGDPRHPIASTLCMMAVSILLALAIHLLVEKRYARQWRAFFSALLGRQIDRLDGAVFGRWRSSPLPNRSAARG